MTGVSGQRGTADFSTPRLPTPPTNPLPGRRGSAVAGTRGEEDAFLFGSANKGADVEADEVWPEEEGEDAFPEGEVEVADGEEPCGEPEESCGAVAFYIESGGFGAFGFCGDGGI